jgi:hypothetical protein
MSSSISCDCNGNCRRQVVNEESSTDSVFIDNQQMILTESPRSPEPNTINEEFPCYTQSFLEEENGNGMDVLEGPNTDNEVLKEKDCEESSSSLIDFKQEKTQKKRPHYRCTADIYGVCNCSSEDDSDSDSGEQSLTVKRKAEDGDAEVERKKVECAEDERYSFLKKNGMEIEKRKCCFKISEFYNNEIQKLSGLV